MSTRPSIWFGANEKRLAELHAEGYTAAEIAKHLGMSRFSVTSKISAMKLNRGHDRRGLNPLVSLVPSPREPMPAPQLRPVENAPLSPFSSSLGCRWIEAKEPVEQMRTGLAYEELICGKPVKAPGESYCAKHHAIVWVRGSAGNAR